MWRNTWVKQMVKRILIHSPTVQRHVHKFRNKNGLGRLVMKMLLEHGLIFKPHLENTVDFLCCRNNLGGAELGLAKFYKS